MIQLTEEMRRSINSARVSGNPCIVATASTEGTPNAGYIGTMMAIDEESLAYRDRSGASPLVHIEENSKVVVLFRDPTQQVGWKFRCTATVHRDGPVYDLVMSRLTESGVTLDPAVKGAAVVLQIDQVLTLYGEVMQERVPNLRW